LEPFRSCFTGPTFRHALVLVTGAIPYHPSEILAAWKVDVVGGLRL
jgi:hypothetical protein